jgi:DNA-binding transcriptional MerR regulator
MRIGEAARLSGLKTSAIRFYEADGVLPGPQRTEAGYRDYSSHDVDLLRFVRRLRSLELPVDDVREIVTLRTAGEAPCATVRTALAREAATIDHRIEELLRLRKELTDLQAAASEITDDWPSTCVCHVLEEPAIDGMEDFLGDHAAVLR